MEIFLQTATSFPTGLYSFLLCVLVLYWIVVALGLLDVDILDFEVDSVMEGAGQTEGLAGLLYKFKLNGVPVTVVLTLLFLTAWILCYFIELLLLRHLPLGILRYPLGILIAVGVMVPAVPFCAAICRALRPLFQKAETTTSKSVLGQVAVVRSGRITLNHGEAVLEDGGAGLILRVRAEEALGFKRGDRVVLLEYLPTEHAYRVISENEFRGI